MRGESFGFTAGGLDRPDIAGVDKSDQISVDVGIAQHSGVVCRRNPRN